MKRKLIVFSLSFFGLLTVASIAAASSPFDIEFPIAELGGCADKEACKVFCDDAANVVACAEFAQKHGLADKRSVEAAKKIQAGGPGGCNSDESCHAYCDDAGHENECVEYGVANGFMTRAEADRALKPGPGGCRGRACQTYCSDSSHEEECFAYAEANGFIPKAEAQKIREFKKKFQERGGGPGGCQSEQECRVYCDDAGHIDECVSFAEEHGFIDKEHAKRIKKIAGTGPGGCKGQSECRVHCDNPANQLACVDFAVENGFMTREEAERARKFAGKTGPGGCQGAQCRDFCEQAGNENSCLEFAEREGILPPEELARAKKFLAVSRQGGPGGCQGRQCQDYCGDPAHQQECFSFAKGNGLITAEEEKHFEAGMKIQQVVQSSGGPGGCKSDGECRDYCTDPSHVEECIAFGATHGGVPPEQVREMLKQFTERRFEVHGGVGEFGPQGFEDFSRFEGESQKRFEEFRMLEEQFRGKGFPGGPPGGFPGAGEFRGAPGEFPGGPGGFSGGFPGVPGGFPGGPDGGAAFVGPGGCTSPTECIRYCTEHKDECFGGSPGTGRGGEHEEEGGFFQGESGAPRLRGNILHEFKGDELPEGFYQLPPGEREQFFHQNFPEFNAPDPSQFPGRGIEGFPGRPGEFPGKPGEFPSRAPEGFPGGSGEFPPGFRPPSSENFSGHPDASGHPFQPGETFRPPEGNAFPSPSGSFNQQPSGETFTPQSGGSFTQPSGGEFHPPSEGLFRPPEGSFTPPSSGSFPSSEPSNSFTQPPSESFSPPPSGSFESNPPPSGSFEQHSEPSTGTFEQHSEPPPPSSQSPLRRFFGSVLESFGR